jgi:hypothetical protein
VQPESHPATPQAAPLPVNLKRYAPERLEQSLFLLLTCVGLGIVADILFRANLLGLNVSLFVTALVVSLYVWSRRTQTFTLSPLLLGSLLLLTWLFSWRDSLFLQFLNLAAQFFLLLLIAGRLTQRLLQHTNFAEMIFNFLQTGISLVISPFAFLYGSSWQDLKFKSKGNASVAFALVRGIVIALPLLVVFAFLLSSADERFAELLGNLFSFDLESIISHVFVITVVSFIMLAGFAQTLFGTPWKEINVKIPSFLSFGVIETSVVFGSLVLLFSSFIAVQFGYLFGGETRVMTSDVTFAQYGRRGFFELVTVTVLLHVVLLFGLWFTSENKAKNLYRWLATTLVVLLYGVIWSAFSRLNLYISTYGLTELRYYSSAATLWIGVVMAYFLCRLHLHSVPKIAASYIVLGLLGIVALYLSNPDARIAEVNLERSQTSVEVDVNYLYNLSLDAVPTMTAFVKNQPENLTSSQLESLLKQKYEFLLPTDWRGFNLGRWQGERGLEGFIKGVER